MHLFVVCSPSPASHTSLIQHDFALRDPHVDLAHTMIFQLRLSQQHYHKDNVGLGKKAIVRWTDFSMESRL